MPSLMPTGKQQFTNNAGVPLAGGKIYTYDAGTTVLKATFQDAAGTVQNPNPIVLNARGEALIYWEGAYDVKVTDANDIVVYTVTNYKSPLMPDDLDADTGTSRISGTWFGGTKAKLSDLATDKGASLIGFLQAGLGAVLRSIYAKLLPTIEPEDFGAKGDGVTDDTLAMKRAATRVREQGGGVFNMAPNKSYYVLPDGGTALAALLDFEQTKGLTIRGNGAKIKTGVVTLGQKCISLKSTFGTRIENLDFESSYAVLDNAAGIDWIEASYGAKAISLENLKFKNGRAGVVVLGAKGLGGNDNDRARDITARNLDFDKVYYPLNFRGAGDNFHARGIVTRNCGRAYFVYNVKNHDVWIDSEQGGPFSDAVLSCYGSTDFYSKLENIKLVYNSPGRYAGSGNQSFDEAMMAVNFHLNDVNPAPCTISNIQIDFNVAARPGDRNQNVFFIRKYDGAGNPDATGARGHNLIGLKIRGWGAALENLLGASLNLFGRGGENWTGESVYGVHVHDMVLGNLATQNSLIFNCTPIVGPCKVERVKASGDLALSNFSGKELSIEESIFDNYSARNRITQTYAVAWTADGGVPNIGSGSLSGVYSVQGGLCTVDLYLKAGADTTFGSGIWHFSLPFARSTTGFGTVGSAMALDSGSNFINGTCQVLAGASTMELLLTSAPGNFTNAVSPIVWANNDYIRATITYPI